MSQIGYFFHQKIVDLLNNTLTLCKQIWAVNDFQSARIVEQIGRKKRVQKVGKHTHCVLENP